MKAQSMRYWVDAYFTLLAVSGDSLLSLLPELRKQENRVAEQRIKAERLWKRVLSRLGSFPDNCVPENFRFSGLQSHKTGDMSQTHDEVCLYQVDKDNKPTDKVCFTSQDEISVIVHFIMFCREQMNKVDPDAYVRQSLLSRGINAENFYTHPQSPAGLIKNPWETERTN
jgi:hypothetical protein